MNMKEEPKFDGSSKEEQLEHALQQIWHETVVSMQHVLHADRTLGFEKFELAANPTIEEMANAIALVERALEIFQEHADKLSFDSHRHVMNCQQSIFWIRRIFVALKRKDESEYDDCISKLQSQRKY